MISHVGCAAVVSQPALHAPLARLLGESRVRVLLLGVADELPATGEASTAGGAEARDEADKWAEGEEAVLYAMYTSGSTGRPVQASRIPPSLRSFTRAGIEWLRCHRAVCMARPYK